MIEVVVHNDRRCCTQQDFHRNFLLSIVVMDYYVFLQCSNVDSLKKMMVTWCYIEGYYVFSLFYFEKHIEGKKQFVLENIIKNKKK